jgi:hypothetical protein
MYRCMYTTFSIDGVSVKLPKSVSNFSFFGFRIIKRAQDLGVNSQDLGVNSQDLGVNSQDLGVNSLC